MEKLRRCVGQYILKNTFWKIQFEKKGDCRDEGEPGGLATKIMEVAEVTFGEVDQGFGDNCLVCNGNDQFLELAVIITVMMVMTKTTRMTMMVTKFKPFEDLAEFGNLVSGSPLTRWPLSSPSCSKESSSVFSYFNVEYWCHLLVVGGVKVHPRQLCLRCLVTVFITNLQIWLMSSEMRLIFNFWNI